MFTGHNIAECVNNPISQLISGTPLNSWTCRLVQCSNKTPIQAAIFKKSTQITRFSFLIYIFDKKMDEFLIFRALAFIDKNFVAGRNRFGVATPRAVQAATFRTSNYQISAILRIEYDYIIFIQNIIIHYIYLSAKRNKHFHVSSQIHNTHDT